MYFFFHLFAGIIIGFIMGDLLHDRRWVIPCGLGAVLPDLIDKPLGHIIFSDSIGYGRIYGHSLGFFLVIVLLGLLTWRFWKTPVICGIAAGIISHEVLDTMWSEPANWFFPLMGPFQGNLPPDYLLVLVSGELSNPLEIIIALFLGSCALVYVKYRYALRESGGYQKNLCYCLLGGALILGTLAGIILGMAMVGDTLPFTGWSRVEDFTLGGIVVALAAYTVWRMHWKIRNRIL